MGPLPLQLALNMSIGIAVAMVSSEPLLAQKPHRSVALGSLMILQLLVIVPAGALLLWKFPDWSLMYSTASADMPMPAPLLAGVYPVVAGLSYLIARALVMRGQIGVAGGLMAAGVVSAFGMLWLGLDTIVVVGETARFRVAPNALRAIGETAVPFLVLASLGGALLGVAGTLFKVRSVGLSMLKSQETVARKRPSAKTKRIERKSSKKKKPALKKKASSKRRGQGPSD